MTANDRTSGLVASAAIKVPCAACASTAITLSGEQTIDGVAVVTNDRVLVNGQASSIDNGIYVATTGTWSRAADCDGNRDLVQGTLVYVLSGSSNSGYWYVSSADAIVVGTDAVDWARSSTVLAEVSAFAQTLLDDADAREARETLGAGTGGASTTPSTSTPTGGELFLTTGTTRAHEVLGLGNAVTLDTGTGAADLPTNADLRGDTEYWIPAAAMTPTITAGCAALAKTQTTAGRPDMETLDFDAITDENCQFLWAMPKSWDASTITAEFHWTHSAGTSFGVAWFIQAALCRNGDTIDVAYGTAVSATDAGGTNEDYYITSETDVITPSGTANDPFGVYFRIYRDVSDASDTLDADARLLGVKLRWVKNAATDD